MDIAGRIIQQALKNGGTISSAEVQALGATRTWLARRQRDGWLERCGPSTYRLPGAESEWRATLAAACHSLGGVVSHESAAQVHGMPRLRRGMLIVSVPVRRTNRFPGVDVRQKTDLTPEQVMDCGGLTVTTPTRTIFDLSAHLGVKRLGRLVDSSVAMDLTSYAEMLTTLGHLGRRGKPGTQRMREVMKDRGGELEHDPSELEHRLYALILDAGLPVPAREYDAPWLAPTNGRVDFAYLDHRVVIEADSRRWHTLADAFLTDRERDNRAQLAGWRVLRFTWWDVEERPDYVVRTIRQGLQIG